MMKFLSIKEKNIVHAAIFLSILSILANNLIVDRIVVIVLFALCIYFGNNERKIINPYYLFALVPLSLLSYVNIGDMYMMELTHSTWVLAIINILAFILSVRYTRPFNNSNNCISIPDDKIYGSTLIFILIFLLQFFIPSISSVIWFFNIVAIVCCFKTGSKKSIVLFIALLLFSISLGTSKLSMLCYCFTFLICFEKYFTKLRMSRTKVLTLVVLSILVMIFSFSFANSSRGKYDSESGLSDYENNGVEWSGQAALFLPYMYFTTPWTNLQYVVETNQRNSALLIFKPLLGYIGLDKYFGIDDSEEIFEPYSSFNTYTFIACHYSDFGKWFSILPTIFLGWYIKKIYSRYLISKSPLDTSVYCLVALATADMFFSNHFFLQSYPFTIFIEMELIKKVYPWKCIETEPLLES